MCPIFEGEEQLKLLNFQHNEITRIQHLSGLRRLIFLDLYENMIEQISGLDSLKSLRVLMLGKNKLVLLQQYILNVESLLTIFHYVNTKNYVKKKNNLRQQVCYGMHY